MVISETAVGIGKVPEAQLDVRGNLNVDGIISQPNKPIFYVYYTTGASTSTVGAITNWDASLINSGNCFNFDDGAFYAPISGIYRFDAHGLYRYTSGSGVLEMTFFINGSNVSTRGMSYSRGNTTSEHQTVHIHFIKYINAGDYVQFGPHIVGTSCDFYYGELLGSFSGGLI